VKWLKAETGWYGGRDDTRGRRRRGPRGRAATGRYRPTPKGRALGTAARQAQARRASLNGARREVVEETGHRVIVGMFLGAIAYRTRGRPKVVQFWFMQAAAYPSRDVMKDIMAVAWLPLAAAIRRLSYPLEKLFLRNVGRHAVLRHKRNRRRKAHARAGKVKRRRSAARTRATKAKKAA